MTPIEWALVTALLSAAATIASAAYYSAVSAVLLSAVKWLSLAITAVMGAAAYTLWKVKTNVDTTSDSRAGRRAARRGVPA